MFSETFGETIAVLYIQANMNALGLTTFYFCMHQGEKKEPTIVGFPAGRYRIEME
jgi:hypothetical protein